MEKKKQGQAQIELTQDPHDKDPFRKKQKFTKLGRRQKEGELNAMKRGSATSGGQEHIELVKLALKKIVDTFVCLRRIMITFEESEFTMDIKIQENHSSYTNAHFSFRPDVIVRAETEDAFNKKEWKSIYDSSAVVFEAETNPHNIFNNLIKIEAYKRIKSRDYGRRAYSFVLVCWKNAKLPASIEPFDEVWKFQKPAFKRS